MKIAVFFNLPSGGAKRALYEQVKRLAKRNTIDAYTLNTADHTFCDLRKFVRNYYIYKFNHIGLFPFNLFFIYFVLPFIQKKIAQEINRKDYDIVFVNPDLFTQAPFLLRFIKKPSVYYSPEPRREFYEKIPRVSKRLTYSLTYPFRLGLKYIDRSNIQHASLLLTNSYYSKTQLSQIYGVDSSINYLGVDTDKFKHIEGVKKQNIVLSVGGFNLLKGHDFVIRSISMIPKSKRPQFVIVGNGGEDEEYIKDLADKGDVTLTLVKNVSDEELVKWYNKAKLFIYAPIFEPFGLALLEALACGVPVIGVFEGGAAEVIKEIDQTLSVERNEVALSNKIVQKLDEHYKYSKMEEYIDKIKTNYNWRRSVAELENYFQKVCRK